MPDNINTLVVKTQLLAQRMGVECHDIRELIGTLNNDISNSILSSIEDGIGARLSGLSAFVGYTEEVQQDLSAIDFVAMFEDSLQNGRQEENGEGGDENGGEDTGGEENTGGDENTEDPNTEPGETNP